MSNSFMFETKAIDSPRIYYERVVYDTLRILWKHKPLIAAVLGVAFACLSAALVFMAPRYTGEAMIRLDFVRDQTVSGQLTAATDAVAIVNGYARIIRSRGTASAVVSVLGLDNDPDYTRVSLPERALSSISSVFGSPAATPHDLAVSRLMRQITVTNDPRSYLITVAVIAYDPERAARLANWVASEYLRGRQREEKVEAYAAAEREMAELSWVFGPDHPNYLNGSAKLKRLKSELTAGAGVAPDMVRFAAGQSLLPAEAVMVPSGPNVMLLFALTIIAGLAVGILLSLLAERGLLRLSVSRRSSGRGKRTIPTEKHDDRQALPDGRPVTDL
jgi:capsular polysaccharide biosynthesis protein